MIFLPAKRPPGCRCEIRAARAVNQDGFGTWLLKWRPDDTSALKYSTSREGIYSESVFPAQVIQAIAVDGQQARRV